MAVSEMLLGELIVNRKPSKTINRGIRKSDKIVVPEKQANNTFIAKSRGVCGGKDLD